MRIAVGIVLYLTIWIEVWGALNADLQYIYQGGNHQSLHAYRYRHMTASTAGFALLPVIWPMSPFMTGFYEHGWCLTRKQCHAEWPEGK